MSKDKRQSEIDHAVRQAALRFGIRLHPSLYCDLVRAIQGNKAVFLDRQSNRVTRWLVRVDGKEVVAVYDGDRKAIVTFLSLDMVRERK